MSDDAWREYIRWYHSEYYKARKGAQTPKEREAELEARRQSRRERQANETPEEREARLTRQRERYRKRKANK